MNTTEAIDHSVQVTAFFGGDDPINSGRINFGAGNSGQTVLTPNVFCREILFADLVLVSSNYHFTLETDDQGGFTVGSSETALNLAGDNCAYFQEAQVFYLESNAYCTIDGLYTTLPTRIDTGGMILINSYMNSTAAVGAGDVILDLSFPAATIASVGSSNFRARLIFAAFTA